MQYPSSPEISERLFTLCFTHFWGSLKRIFLLILALVAVKSFYTHLPVLPMFLHLPIGIMITLVVIFILVMALYRVDSYWRGESLTWQETWEKTLSHILKIYWLCLLITLGLILIYLAGKWLILSFLGMSGQSVGIAAIIFVGIPFIIVLIYLYLAIPLLALTEMSVVQALHDSMVYNQQRLLFAIFFYVEIVIVLVASATFPRHAQWLLSHYLMEVNDLVVFSLLLPFIMNQILLVINDRLLVDKMQEY